MQETLDLIPRTAETKQVEQGYQVFKVILSKSEASLGYRLPQREENVLKLSGILWTDLEAGGRPAEAPGEVCLQNVFKRKKAQQGSTQWYISTVHF